MQDCDTNKCDTSKCEPEWMMPPTGCKMTDVALEMANQAWGELMKEKMKKAYEAKIGAKMDTKAAAAVDAVIAYWEGKMEAEHKYRAKVSDFQKVFFGKEQ